MTVDEAVRLPSEFGHIVQVGVQWRGKMYNIRMFFPQAKMPTRNDVQDEIIKVYPSIKKAKKLIGWSPKISITKGLGTTNKFYTKILKK